MSKPKDIPQDVWDTADEWSGWPLWADLNAEDQATIQEGVARAILAATAAEREACALIADAVISRDGNMMFIQGAGWIGLRQVMSNAIRLRGETQ